MVERRKSDFMPLIGKAIVASIEVDILREAIKRLAGTDQATLEGFAVTIRDLSVSFTSPGGAIDEGFGLGPRQREKVREVVATWSFFAGEDFYTI